MNPFKNLRAALQGYLADRRLGQVARDETSNTALFLRLILFNTAIAKREGHPAWDNVVRQDDEYEVTYAYHEGSDRIATPLWSGQALILRLAYLAELSTRGYTLGEHHFDVRFIHGTSDSDKVALCEVEGTLTLNESGASLEIERALIVPQSG